jgi:hypothetical protein
VGSGRDSRRKRERSAAIRKALGQPPGLRATIQSNPIDCDDTLIYGFDPADVARVEERLWNTPGVGNVTRQVTPAGVVLYVWWLAD